MVEDGKEMELDIGRMGCSVVTVKKEGYSQRAIARKQKISLCAVQILKKKRKTGTVKDKVKTGRPHLTSKRQDRLLKRLSLSNGRATSK